MRRSARPNLPARASGEALFLDALFAELRSANLPHAVLRNYDLLPETTGGSDLDLLLAPGDERAVAAAVQAAARAAGGTAIGSVAFDGFCKLFLLGRAAAGRPSSWGLRIDANFGVAFQGMPCVDPAALLASAEVHRGVSVVPRGIAAVLGVLKELLHHDAFAERYRAAAVQAARESWPAVCAALSPMGPTALEALRGAILASHSEEDARPWARAIRRALRGAALRREPVRILRRRAGQEWSKLRRFVRPPGVVLAVLGVDGVGKSTVIAGLEPVLAAATHGALVRQHLRPGVLPPLARWRSVRPGEVRAAPVLDPHGATPSGALGSALRLGYYVADYIAGYWLRVRPSIARQPAVWLFDRYAYDMQLDPRRFRVRLPTAVTRLFAGLAPAPDLVLCLHAPAEVIARRKQELPLPEIERQLSALKELAAREPRAVLVSADGTEEEVRERVLGVVLAFLARRSGAT